MNELEEKEKALLQLMFRIADVIISMCNGALYIDTEFFDRNDLFRLGEKIGIDY